MFWAGLTRQHTCSFMIYHTNQTSATLKPKNKIETYSRQGERTEWAMIRTRSTTAQAFTIMSFTETLIPSSDSCFLVFDSWFILHSTEVYTWGIVVCNKITIFPSIHNFLKPHVFVCELPTDSSQPCCLRNDVVVWCDNWQHQVSNIITDQKYYFLDTKVMSEGLFEKKRRSLNLTLEWVIRLAIVLLIPVRSISQKSPSTSGRPFLACKMIIIILNLLSEDRKSVA